MREKGRGGQVGCLDPGPRRRALRQGDGHCRGEQGTNIAEIPQISPCGFSQLLPPHCAVPMTRALLLFVVLVSHATATICEIPADSAACRSHFLQDSGLPGDDSEIISISALSRLPFSIV